MQQGIHRASRPNFRPNYLAAAVIAALAANAPAYGDTVLSTVEVTAERNAGSLNLDQPSTTGSRTGVTVRELPWKTLHQITRRITDIPGVNRCLYDLTPKPPATVEYI